MSNKCLRGAPQPLKSTFCEFCARRAEPAHGFFFVLRYAAAFLVQLSKIELGDCITPLSGCAEASLPKVKHPDEGQIIEALEMRALFLRIVRGARSRRARRPHPE